jgi:polysaccharide pyruvyl transferase WcaK-like protein
MGQVLLLGAYGNGNIGDACQAASIARHIAACRPDIDAFAVSLSRAALPFAFPAERLFEGGHGVTGLAGINGFAALVIGGGGLFAAPHRPLDSAEWAARLRLPVIVLANGATPAVVERCRPLLAGAAFLSARDPFSVDALRAIRPDVELLPDPILADPAIGPIAVPRRQGMCVIPRKMSDHNRPAYEWLAGIMQRGDSLLSIFPAADRASGALAVFAGHPGQETTALEAVLDRLARSAFVVSERLHGCILALKLGIPCLGLTTSEGPDSKIVSLYRQLGIPDQVIDLRRQKLDRAAIEARLAALDMAAVQQRIGAMTATLRAGLSRVLSPIG